MSNPTPSSKAFEACDTGACNHVTCIRRAIEAGTRKPYLDGLNGESPTTAMTIVLGEFLSKQAVELLEASLNYFRKTNPIPRDEKAKLKWRDAFWTFYYQIYEIGKNLYPLVLSK